MMDWRPFDARDRDPEVRKERVKLVAGGISATGLALILGTIVAPFLDPSREPGQLRALAGFSAGAVLILFAVWLLRYIKIKE